VLRRTGQARSPEFIATGTGSGQGADAGRQLWSEDFAFHQALVAFTEVDALVTCFARVVNMSMFHQTAMISPVAVVTYDRHSRRLDDLCAASPEEAEARVQEHIRPGKEALLETG
jgi:DNA-binding FadR family transcriptional regulator